jgi:hypothetical protein
MAAEKASAAILADAQRPAARATPPSRPDRRHALAHLPRPRKPTRTKAVQEIR